MKDYQRDFIAFAISAGVLKFGAFKLKSGRVSPYFFNAGLFCTGAALAQLGKCYAAAVHDNKATLAPDVLFGPAYKGIPLVSATAMALATEHGVDLPYAFNRKEAKDHGEGGTLVGAALVGRVVIIDDVITAGTAVRESVDIIKKNGAIPAGVVIALDRQERGATGTQSAIAEVEATLGMPVVSIITLTDILVYLRATGAASQEDIAAIEAYRVEYGAQ